MFGVDAGAFAREEESEFAKYANMCVTFSMREKLASIAYMVPGLRHLIDLLKIPIYSPTATKYFVELVKDILRERELSDRDQTVCLVPLMNKVLNRCKSDPEDAKGDQPYLETLVIANLLIMLVAGLETTGMTLGYCIWALALNPGLLNFAYQSVTSLCTHDKLLAPYSNLDVQKKLQDEIDSHFGDGEEVDNLELEAIQSLQYLEQVILESSRRYTVTPILFRHCTKDYLLPGTDVRIKKGWEVHILPAGIHMDAGIYHNPEEFDPSRFTREARASRHPMAFQAFGQGQRNCVGRAFALLGRRDC